MTILLATRLLMGLLYVVAGINHLWHPAFYRPMMPPYLPFPETLNLLAGVAEIALGVGLLKESTAPWTAWGVIALLIAVFPANLYMWQTGGAGYDLPQWALVARLPLQLVLIAWAYVYTRA